MIVTCERCATQFQLDDTRIPESGVRVRCSRCKHAFEIHKKAPGPASAAVEDEESDWQFNEDPPKAGPGARGSAASVVDDLLGGGDSGGTSQDESLFGDSSVTSGLELRDDPRSGVGAESEAAAKAAEAPPARKPAAAPHRDASPIAMPESGASGLDLEGDPPSAGPAPMAQAPDPVEDLASDLADELSADDAEGPGLSATPATPEAPAPPPAPASDELSPADWDFLADSDPAMGPAGRGALRVDPDELVDDRPAWRTGLERAGQGVGWLLVAALFAFGLHGGLRVEPDVSLGPPVASRAGDAELQNVTGRFVDHAEEGTVYVVSGRVQNTGPQAIRAGTLALEVQDADGRALSPPAPVASPLSSQAVREGRLAEPWRRSPALRPGESRAFQAVLGPLPAGAQRLSLTTVEPPPEPAAPESASAEGGGAGAAAQTSAQAAAARAPTGPAAPAP